MAVVSEILQQLQGLAGVVIITLGAWALSEDRRGRPSFRWILGALLMQVIVALLVVRVPFVWSVIGLANHAVAAIEKATLVGSSYMFGYTGGAPAPFVLKEGALSPVIIAFQILPLIIVYSALAALLWRWGVLSRIVAGLSWALRRTLGVSGVVGLSSGASIFLGVVEAPLVVRAYFERMSRSELFAVMTLASTVPDAVGHMISASLISLPAAILVARLMVPGNAATEASVEETGLHYDSSIDAIVRGTMDGVQLFLAVIGMIIVIFALVTLVDQVLALAPAIQGEPLTLRRVFGWLFAPFMWTLGVPWDQAPQAGALMGTKTILNEYVAYMDLAALPPGSLDPRSQLIVTYALCGVANLASVGLLVSTIGTLAPSRRAEAASLGMKSWVAGNMASAMTGAVIGLVTLVR